MQYFKYFFYLLRHKYYVYIGCKKYKVPLWIAITHDWDKFLPHIFYAFANKRFGKKWNEEIYQRAWQSHQRRSKHHYEHWIVFNAYQFADNCFYYLEIPEVYIREMCADWFGAGYAQKGEDEVIFWYEKYKNQININDKSRKVLEKILYE